MIRIFDTNKFKSEKKDRNKNIPVKYIDQKRVVDINTLLNRVRMDKKNETKRKIFFCSSTILALGLLSTLLMIIN